jgi:hypothetical protein
MGPGVRGPPDRWAPVWICWISCSADGALRYKVADGRILQAPRGREAL